MLLLRGNLVTVHFMSRLSTDADYGLNISGRYMAECDCMFSRAAAYWQHVAKILPVNDHAPPCHALVTDADPLPIFVFFFFKLSAPPRILPFSPTRPFSD